MSSIPLRDQNEKIMCQGILLLIKMSPSFIYKIINEYIYAYSTGLIDKIIPIEIKNLRVVISKQITIERELIEAFNGLQSNQKELVRKFFKVIS
jgi:hypothetical protein